MGLTSIITILGRLLDRVLGALPYIGVWWASKTHSRKAEAEAALSRSETRNEVEDEVDTLSDDDLARELRRYQRGD